jgi:hypothetical protein
MKTARDQGGQRGATPLAAPSRERELPRAVSKKVLESPTAMVRSQVGVQE